MIWDHKFFLLAIAENLYKNAERFTTDKSSIHISIKEKLDSITIKSSNISLQWFDEENRQTIISGQWNILSQEWNHTTWQWVYLIDLSQQIKKIWWNIDIIDFPVESGQYKTNIEITIPKK
jgi:hypothetical protein